MLLDKAVFLDRDGTIIEQMGYINHFSRIKIFPFAVEAIRLFRQANFKIIVVTNQAGVAKGYLSESYLNEMHERMLSQFETMGAKIDRLYYCPHHPKEGKGEYKKDCNCRKPKTGMIDKAVKEFDIDLKRSIVIGDRDSDIEMAHRAQIRSAFVLTGYGTGEYVNSKGALPFKPTFIFNDLLQAAQTIVHLDLATN